MICLLRRPIDENANAESVSNLQAARPAMLPIDGGEGNDSLVFLINCIPTVRPTSHERI